MNGVLVIDEYYVSIDLSALDIQHWSYFYNAAKPLDSQKQPRGISLIAKTADWKYLGCANYVNTNGMWRISVNRQLTDVEVAQVQNYMLNYAYPHSPLQKDAWIGWMKIISKEGLSPTERSLLGLIRLIAPSWAKNL